MSNVIDLITSEGKCHIKYYKYCVFEMRQVAIQMKDAQTTLVYMNYSVSSRGCSQTEIYCIPNFLGICEFLKGIYVDPVYRSNHESENLLLNFFL